LVAQIAQFDVERTLGILLKNGYQGLDREAVAQRVQMARVWIERFAPEEQKVEVPREIPDAARELPADQKQFLAKFAAAIRTLTDGEAIHNAVFGCAQTADGIGSKRAFEAIYKALLGRERGPRAGAFIAFLGPAWVADRFDAASRS
jgi:lysyl-tRNA synthetase class 1